ncbi:prolipoprotein diacylglyceryl transferase family protein [Roseibium algicola]|uniref:prolipoprotein diacylglyceryl transferase family protein n=1 Tax=Roseibium algicola TaxID=2857014 RepID=UPI0034582C7A
MLLYLALKHGSLKRPGALTGVFLTGYGIARSLVELFRQPDAQFITLGNPIGHVLHFETWGVTMGQLLSLPMVMVGLGLICMRPRGHHASVS